MKRTAPHKQPPSNWSVGPFMNLILQLRFHRADGHSRQDSARLVLRTIQLIHPGRPLLAFPAKAGTHACCGHRLSPVKRDFSREIGASMADNRVNDSEHEEAAE